MSESGQRQSFTFKLRPTAAQERLLDETLWRCRDLYNAGLQQRIWAYRCCGATITRYQQEAELKDIRADLLEYATIHRHVLQDVLARLDKASQAFFRRVKAGAAPGFPRYQGRARFPSFTYKEFGNGAQFDTGWLVLSKIGRIAVRWSRPLEGTPKTVTISREADGWYLVVSCAEICVQPLLATGKETGIAVGLKVLLSTADGLAVENPRHHRKAEQRLTKAQRRVSRCQKGSKRRKKAAAQCAKHHLKVKRQRADFHHKTARTLIQTYDVIYLEDLQIRNLVRNRHLAKSINDAGWGQFRTILEGKAAYAGRQVIALPPQYTSQDYSGCRARVPKSLSIRTHICPVCGLVMDRDENAAINIHSAGRALRGGAA